MHRKKEFTCKNCNKTFLRPKNRLNNGRINPDKLIFCDSCFAVCVICNVRHGGNGKTCSKECSKILREKTNIEKYGVSHNWGTNHPGRETCKQTMLEKYGVSHNFQKGDLREKQDAEIMNKYGVTNIFQIEEIKEKSKHTMLGKYGVENPSQDPNVKTKKIETHLKNYGVSFPAQYLETFEKQQKSGYSLKETVLPSGKIMFLQGYEPFTLNELLSVHKEEEIVNDCKYMPEIWYYYNDEKHRYYPDFFIPSDNLIIEVKSVYTMQLDITKNLLKKARCVEMGFHFEFRIYDNKMQLIDESIFY